ncbi:MAG TPA: FISUMP domain-containing protein [Bacteroidales bacterium]|nr:FISUMP domain-containing protein [Bacteroidales bacterium]
MPELSTYEISGLTATSAVSGGVVISDGGEGIISRGICWSQQSNPEITGKITSDGTGIGSFISNLTGLAPGTRYYIRAYATNSIGTNYGEEISFITKGEPPALTACTVTGITTTSAVLQGTINPNDLSTEIYFEYGTTSNYGSTGQGNNNQITGDYDTTASVTISDLVPGTVYHFRLKAVNQLGQSFSEDRTFTTLGQKPTYTNFSIKSVSTNNIKLSISVIANYLTSNVTIEYGTSNLYGSSMIPDENSFTGNTLTLMEITLGSLTPGTYYYFRVKLENSLGVTYTGGKSFKTYNAVDADNNGYYSVIIGAQEWLSENLKSTHYSNGDSIPNIKDEYNWSALTSPGYCTYMNEQPGVYGNLYNFYVASDSRNVCPAGWHVPSMDEWNTLISQLGGAVEADKKIREAGLAHWYFDMGANNSTGLSILPAGHRDPQGEFFNRGASTHIWSSTQHSGYSYNGGTLVALYSNAPLVDVYPMWFKDGASIRCLKD